MTVTASEADDHQAADGREVTLQATALSLNLGGVQILNDVSFNIFDGEFVGMIGPNGAGKTSLINVISGTVPITTGSVKFFDHEIKSWTPFRRAKAGIGRTFQTSYLFGNLSVLENVRLAVQAHTARWSAAMQIVRRDDETIELAQTALARVSLGHRSKMLADHLSHGDKRKLELALLLASEPKLILLDEPMAGVSVNDVEPLMDLIRHVHEESRATILMVEHHMEVVLGLAQRVAVLHHGALLALDKPEKVMSDERVQTAYLGEPL